MYITTKPRSGNTGSRVTRMPFFPHDSSVAPTVLLVVKLSIGTYLVPREVQQVLHRISWPKEPANERSEASVSNANAPMHAGRVLSIK